MCSGYIVIYIHPREPGLQRTWQYSGHFCNHYFKHTVSSKHNTTCISIQPAMEPCNLHRPQVCTYCVKDRSTIIQSIPIVFQLDPILVEHRSLLASEYETRDIDDISELSAQRPSTNQTAPYGSNASFPAEHWAICIRYIRSAYCYLIEHIQIYRSIQWPFGAPHA
jgi:hypothetical protein